MKVKTNGVLTNYNIKGKGKNVVLIHGVIDNLNMWYNQRPAFSKEYRVITYDVRGSGQSDSPSGGYSISLFCQDLYELMKTLGIEYAYFLGFSMGGRIALELTITHPEMVKALILASSSPILAPPSVEAREHQQINQNILDKGDIKGFIETMAADALSADFKLKSPSEFKKYKRVKLQNKAQGITGQMSTLAEMYSQPFTGDIKCPVLIIVGRNDFFIGVNSGMQANKAIPNSKLVILPTGHAIPIEMPDKFNAVVLNFLSELSV